MPMPPNWFSSPDISRANTSTAEVCPSCGASERIVSITAGTVIDRPQKVPSRPRKISRLVM